MSGSGARFAVAVVFNLTVAGVFHFFGAGLAICWLTFLMLCIFAGLTEIGLHLGVIEGKLDEMSKPVKSD